MDREEFRSEIVSRLAAEYDDDISRREAFLSEVVDDLCYLEQCDGCTGCHFESVGTNNKKIEIDGYNFNEYDKTMSIFYCKYGGGEIPEVLTKTEIEKAFGRAKAFVNDTLNGNIKKLIYTDTPEYFAAKTILDNREQIQRYRFFIITDDIISERQIKDLDIEFVDDKPTQLSIWDMSKYFDEKIAKKGHQDIDIVFENYGYSGINCIRANEISEGADYDAYLCVMPGKLLSDIYTKYGGQLLEANVRSFLSVRGKVNRGIRDTIRNEPNRFFAYNNGISTTATELDTVMTDKGLLITRIKSLQIVNGGQTTASINAATYGKTPSDISDVYVPMKICVIPEDAPDHLTQLISEYSNTQNKVSKSDFFSNSPFHVKFEKISRRMNAPAIQGSVYTTKWYYERARGSYMQELIGKSSAEIKSFQRTNPKDQIIKKTELAVYRNCFEKRPYDVSKGPDTNFVKFGDSMEELWNSTQYGGSKINDNYFKETVAMAIIHRSFVKILRNKKIAPWCIGGEGSCIAAYTISRFVHELEIKKVSIDYEKIWNEQKSPVVVTNQLMDLAYTIHTELEKISSETTKSIPENCKMEKTWNTIKMVPVKINEEVKPYLTSLKKQEYSNKNARLAETRKEKMHNSINIVEKGSGYWQKVLEYGSEHGIFSSFEKDILRVAANMNQTGKPPSENQCKYIQMAHKKALEHGFGIDD